MEDIIDFLPIYPYIDDKNFNTKISQKKELYDYKLEPYEKFPEKPGDLFNHQKLISRFFSSNTPYDQLLLFHDMGTGKTCTSVACIEQIKEENSNFKGAYIFTKGELLHKNYKHDLILKCNEKNKYFNGKTKSGNLSYTKIKEYYKFRTFQTFVSYLSDKSDEYIIKNYSNYIIVIDEVHNIRKSYIDIDEDEEEDKNDQDDEDKTVKKEAQKKEIKEEMKKIYPQFHRFLHLIKNCKILLMSGTPMKDTFVEIADIMNLILPIDNQIPIKKEFIDKYFTKKNEDEDDIIYQLKNNNNKINELKSFFKGRVSYLKSMQSSIIKKFIGNKNYNGLNKFIVHPVKMEDNQNTGYIDALKKDNKKNDNKSSFDYNSTLASLFVFPDSSYGKTGYNNYVNNNDQLNTKFINFIKEKGNNHDNMLEQIAKCSTKYAFTIRKILENVNNIDPTKRKCMFVYSNKVSYGGTILFALLLNLFGFSSATSKIINKKAKRYILVKSEEGKNVNADIIKEVFNSSKNIYGEYISVVIGSRILSEGFSLFHIQEEFILTPYWNYSETDQAIARGIRSDSHNLLLDGFEYNYLDQLDDSQLENITNELNIDFSSSKETNINNIIKNKKYIKQSPIKPEIHIYLLTSIPINKKNISIDIKHYKKSEIKDMNNKIIERLIKESSFDCYFNYKRNRYNDSFNNLRECDYLPCEYKCDFKTSFLDYSTDQLYYLNEDKNISIKNKILNIFKQKYYLTIDDVEKYSKSLNINMKYFFLFLFQIIDNKEIVYDRLGLECFMYENNNIFYISDSKINNNYLSIYYNENINIQKDYKSLNLLTDKSLDVNFIETLFKETDIHKIISKLLQLKVEVVEILLEEIILSKLNIIENDFANLVFDNFLSKYCLEVKDKNILYISWLKCNNNKMHNLRILIKKEDNNLIWIDSDSTKADSSDSVSMKKFKKFLGELIKKSQDFFENYLKEMGEKIGYYGILAYDENKNQKFNIVKINELKNKKKEVVKKPKTKSKKKDKESTSKDSRTKNTGRFCESWDKSELIYIIVKFKITFDDYSYKFENDLDKFNSDDLDDEEFDKIKSYGKINKEEETKKIILYLNKRKKTDLCEIIQNSFQSNKLIINYFKY